MSSDRRTVGEAVAGLPVSEAVAYLAIALTAIGSLGPWVTTFVGSVSGTSGDGTITLVLAIVAAIAAWCSWLRTAILASVVAAAVAAYDASNVDHVTGNSVLVHAGWGLHATLVGAIVATLALARAYFETRQA